jgi:elongator complex protein 1
LRQKKADDPLAFIDGADGGDEDIPDNLSIAPTDASTTGTFMTRYTNRSTGTLATNATRKTSKNKRREERKRARGKKGTIYEEEYLVNSIARLIERLNENGDDVAKLVEGMMRRAMRERAMAIDAAMRDVTEACRQCLGEVFASSAEPASTVDDATMNGEGQARPSGGQGVLFDALASSELRREAPVLKAFEQLSLVTSRP